MNSWIDELRGQCGPLTDAASLFAAQLGAPHDPPRGVPGLLAISRAVRERASSVPPHGEHDDERLFVELAGSYLAVVLADSLGTGEHVARGGQHRLRVSQAGFFDPFAAVERALEADDAGHALAVEVARAEAEARGTGPLARVSAEVERQLKARDARYEVVERFGPQLKLRLVRDSFELDLSRVVRSVGDARGEVLTRAVERLLAALPGRHAAGLTWAEAAPRLLPRPVGPRLLAGLSARENLLVQPLAGEAQLCFVLRHEGRARYLRADEARSWDLDASALRQRAVQNLAAQSERAKLMRMDSDDGPLVLARSGDGLDAARVLLPGLVDVLAPELGTPFVVGIPHRDALFACPADAREAVALLEAKVRDQALRAPHAISAQTFVVEGPGKLRLR